MSNTSVPRLRGLKLLLALAALALIIAFIVLSYPASIALLVCGGLWVRADDDRRSEIKSFAPFLRSVTIGLLLVCVAAAVVKLNEKFLDIDDVDAIQSAVIATHEQFKSLTSLGWLALVITLALLAVVSYVLPRFEGVSVFLTARRWIGSTVAAGTVVTSFCIASEPAVWWHGGEEAQQHFDLAFRRAELRRDRAIRQRDALQAAAVAVRKMTPADVKYLRDFAEETYTSSRRGEILDDAAGYQRENDPINLLDDNGVRHTRREIVATKAAEHSFEQARDQQEMALRTIIDETAKMPQDAVSETVIDFIIRSAFGESGAFEGTAKIAAGQVADALWGRLTSRRIEDVSDRILARLRPQNGESGKERAENEKNSVETTQLARFAELVRTEGRLAQELKDAVAKGDRTNIEYAAMAYNAASVDVLNEEATTGIDGLLRSTPEAGDTYRAGLLKEIDDLKVKAELPVEVKHVAERAREEVREREEPARRGE